MLALVVSLTAYFTYALQHKAYEDLKASIILLVEKIGFEVRDEDSEDVYLAILEREITMLNQKIGHIKNQLKENISHQKELQEQIYFYKSVIAPEELNKKGVSVFLVQVLKPVRSKNSYPIEIVLRKHNTQGLVSSGRIEVSVEGQYIHTLEDSTYAPKVLQFKSLDFSFKYFQRVVGEIDIPTGFVPQSLYLTVVAKKSEPIVERYTWHQVASNSPTPER